jgi:hypothetical protein
MTRFTSVGSPGPGTHRAGSVAPTTTLETAAGGMNVPTRATYSGTPSRCTVRISPVAGPSEVRCSIGMTASTSTVQGAPSYRICAAVYVLRFVVGVCCTPSSVSTTIGAAGGSLARSSSMCCGSFGSTRTAIVAPASCIFGM